MRTPMAQAIRDARRSCDLTQAELALRVGVKDRTVVRWERNGAKPTEGHQRTLVQVIAELNQNAGSTLRASFSSGGQPAQPPTPAAPPVDPRIKLEHAVFVMADELDLAPSRVRGSLVRLLQRLGEASFTFQSARQELELLIEAPR